MPSHRVFNNTSSAGFEAIRLHDARHALAAFMLKQGLHSDIVQEWPSRASTQIGHAHILTWPPVCRKLPRKALINWYRQSIMGKPACRRVLLIQTLYVKSRADRKLASGEVTERIMVPLSKSGLRLIRSVGSNPTLSAERCWSGLTGTPGERVSGFPRPWVRIPPSPPIYVKASAGKPNLPCGTHTFEKRRATFRNDAVAQLT